MEERKINPGHAGIRSVLRWLGPALVCCGAILTAIGLISFFASFGSFGVPRYFWCAFLGMPMMVGGIALTKVAYFGAIARYMAAETAPVGKDTFNYMARETQGGVRDIAAAIKEGIAGGEKVCSQCDRKNDPDAAFCDQCGGTLVATKRCSACSAMNDVHARFCDRCGGQLSAE